MSALVLVMDNCFINKIEPLEDCIKDSSLALVADANLTELPLLSMTIVPITAETFRHIILITCFKKLKEVQNAPVDLFLYSFRLIKAATNLMYCHTPGQRTS